jgi:hypothetical protein
MSSAPAALSALETLRLMHPEDHYLQLSAILLPENCSSFLNGSYTMARESSSSRFNRYQIPVGSLFTGAPLSSRLSPDPELSATYPGRRLDRPGLTTARVRPGLSAMPWPNV